MIRRMRRDRGDYALALHEAIVVRFTDLTLEYMSTTTVHVHVHVLYDSTMSMYHVPTTMHRASKRESIRARGSRQLANGASRVCSGRARVYRVPCTSKPD